MNLITSLITVTLTDHVMRGVLWNGSLPHAAGNEHRKKNKKWGFPEPKLDGNPQRKNAAARYSPTPSRVQYHRRARP